MLTQERLKELLSYDPETGIFINLLDRGKRAKKGLEAGSIQSYGYRRVKIDMVEYRTHRLAWLYMTGFFPKDQIDHINHVTSDNRWCNLREVTTTGNAKNRSLSTANKSGVIGISWEKGRSKWHASIRVAGKTIHIGRYKNKEEAIKARRDAEVKLNFHPNHGAAA